MHKEAQRQAQRELTRKLGPSKAREAIKQVKEGKTASLPPATRRILGAALNTAAGDS